MGNKLCVRLPRLIMLVRLACGVETSGPTVLSALHLADELLKFRDEEAEVEFLRDVGVISTKLARDHNITQWSLDFKSLSSFEAGAYYWHSRSTLLQLCSRLRSLFPTICDMYTLPSLREVQADLQRYASNIFMSVQFARTNTARKRRRLLGQSLLACWSTLQDTPVLSISDADIDQIRSWLLDTLNITLLGRLASIEARDMDEAAELFKGGALVGRYKDLYDQPKTLSLQL